MTMVRTAASAAGTAITLALSRLGEPYLYGGDAARGHTDCAGLVQWAYAQAGVILPRVVDAQHRATPEVTGLPQAGDLLFYGNDDHVTMVINSAEMVEDPHTGSTVRRVPIRSDYTGHTRPTGDGGAGVAVADGGTAGLATATLTAADTTTADTGLGATLKRMAFTVVFVGAGVAMLVIGAQKTVGKP
jgi:hypothetical protein